MFGTARPVRLLTICLFIALFIFPVTFSAAKEGMWIPATLRDREQDMKAMGLQIPVDQLYNSDGTGLNNAVVLFGRGCTGEVISSKGLVLTNHHCGYGSVQNLSSTENDYFEHGFWATNNYDELPCKGLTVTFVRRMENVTDKILTGIADTMNDRKRDSIIARRIAATEKEFRAATQLDASIKPYYDGNQYWVAITETFRDIRLVGFPPNGIGAFGGDVENWIWPRHTGDFSIFRIYAGPDNKPADYSTSNEPYHADIFFKINAGGYKEGDFTMVYGFPGTTREYISSYELKQVYEVTDPISIAARTRKLAVWTRHMGESRDNYIKYTSKRAGVANGWKKWKGEVSGLTDNDALGKKEAYEKEFDTWATHDATLPYAAGLLNKMKAATDVASPLIAEDQYNKEMIYGVELIQQGAVLDRMARCMAAGLQGAALTDTLNKIANETDGFYKNYDAATDKDVFVTLMSNYLIKCSEWAPPYYRLQYTQHKRDVKSWAADVYATSMAVSSEKLKAFAAGATAGDSVRIHIDPVWQLYHNTAALRTAKIIPVLDDYYRNMHFLDRLYTKAQMAKDHDRSFYPDANLTLRLSYGNVKGLKQEPPAPYLYQTNLGDVVALDDTTVDIFTVPGKLKALYYKKDYAGWSSGGVMPVAFLATNHTTGGNSGSPVLNAKGELIGTNFDRAYEGTMSDYLFDPERCRNISVDIRYTLFLIERFGNAGWLIDEMKIVH